MVRTQIQLTETQAASLKKMAQRYHVSVAELIRRGVDYLLASGSLADPDQCKRKALSAAGRFASGCNDISKNHDSYLAEDLAK
jgi:hypothetical protein